VHFWAAPAQHAHEGRGNSSRAAAARRIPVGSRVGIFASSSLALVSCRSRFTTVAHYMRPPYRRHRGPKADRRRALELLAASCDGVTEAIMIAHGFTVAQMVEIVRARLATSPARTGSAAVANTIGMIDVACFAAMTGPAECVTMTSLVLNRSRHRAQGPDRRQLRARRERPRDRAAEQRNELAALHVGPCPSLPGVTTQQPAP
jgi:hypothetical protein